MAGRGQTALLLVTLCVSVSVSVSQGSVCQSIITKNNVTGLAELRDCTVVEGSVLIVLIENTTEADFRNISFPKLREITEYLLLYRVRGLRSIGQLFPNLEKIGGSSLFQNYALIVVNMVGLQVVNLSNLREISRGSVIFFKNYDLCYLETIRWENITKWGVTANYMANNKANRECPKCHGCPEDRCWNSDICQIREPVTDDCHELCVGGCSGPGPWGCYSCQGVFDHEGNCVQGCPPNTFVYLNRRCVTREECRSMNVTSDGITQSKCVIYEDKCLEKCPSGFASNVTNGHCYPCQGGLCKISCKGENIKTIADAQRFKGCTQITGSINLSIATNASSSFYKELEENLGSIEEVEESIIIKRASITNLNFFKNLSIIHGKKGNDTNIAYSLYVLDNSNLQELWNWTLKQNLSIPNGKLFFHHNPKLCFSQIQRLMEIIHYNKNISNYDISKESNGDMFPCESSNIEITMHLRSFDKIDIYVPYINQNSSTPSLLRYVLYYKKYSKNYEIYDNLNQCSENAWRAKDLAIDPDDKTVKHHGIYMNLTNLMPDTQYVLYITSYNISRVIAKSKFYYVKTLPETPSELRWFHAFSNSSSEICMEWDPPVRVNGKLKEYVITWSVLNVEKPSTMYRDYCKNPMFSTNEETPILSKQKIKNNNEDCCIFTEKTKVEKEHYENLCTSFWDNHSAKKHYNPKFSSCESFFNHYVGSSLTQNQVDKKSISTFVRHSPNDIHLNDKMKTNSLKSRFMVHEPYVRHLSANSHNTLISGLKHFTDYLVSIKACREIDPDESNSSEDFRCSKTEITVVRTAKDKDADDIPGTISKSVTHGTLSLKWNPPKTPNGFIVGFFLEYKHIDNVISKKTYCVPYHLFMHYNMGFVIKRIPEGKYEFRLCSISLAGYGHFTNFIEFDVSESKLSILDIIACVIIEFVIVILIFLLFHMWKFRHHKSYSVVLAEVNPNYNNVMDPYEIDRNNIEFGKELGVGSFGKVFKGLLKHENIECAIKTVNDDATQDGMNEFLSEVSVMKSMRNAHHVVKLLGVVTKGHPPLVIMELMELGDLKSYLRLLRDSYPLTNGVMIKMSLEIADAMAFMEAQKFIHRDLAARNCMVNMDFTIKVGDFGMARDIYETDYYRKSNKGLLPIRWMAPESLKYGEFTTQSDIWSYGVVLWEIATMAEQPYQGFSNEQVLQDVIDGKILEIPKDCPLILKSVMNICWKRKPSSRTSFMQILTSMEYYHDDEFKMVSFYNSTEATCLRKCVWEYVEMNPVQDPLLTNDTNQNVEVIRTYSVLPSSGLSLPKKETFTILEEDEEF